MQSRVTWQKCVGQMLALVKDLGIQDLWPPLPNLLCFLGAVFLISLGVGD